VIEEHALAIIRRLDAGEVLPFFEYAILRHVLSALLHERDEARDIACKLLHIAEKRGPRVFGVRPDWLEATE